ncbi:MAG: serine/threonine-protein kinase [Planctomycetota bacterium]|jgi:serine/threonine-protein kinase
MADQERSILARIEAGGQDVPRIRLEGPPAAAEPAEHLETGKLRGTGRYEILGRIAEGGVGLVLKGHDVDLGRDVALKVLRDDHRGNRELVTRVVEEAQIGGQLQHPGVVPIYELGIAGGGRPYFAMKLVKGETLAIKLAARESPAAESRRFLVYFEQACRTMAYAHSRGVIHRDLKPSNVMIGAFGEVQIVDWGFAKVLARGGIADERRAKQPERDLTLIATARSATEGSQSVAGSVMGTPAYMPPEQALGRVEELDERSDVFSLGAILTEILTGKPPYVGEDLLTKAAQSQLDDAQARLDACGADEGLVALAKACLSPLRQDRPKDAGVLANGVSAHLAAAEERARRSEVAAVESREDAARAKTEAAEVRAKAEAERAKAEEQRTRAQDARARAEAARAEAEEARRARKQGLRVAGVILLAILIAGGAWFWHESSRSEKARRATLAADDAVREGAAHAAEGRWAEALAAAERAVVLARSGAPAEILTRVESFQREVGAAATAAQAARAVKERDEAMLLRLAEIRVKGTDGYSAAFEEYGIDLAAEGAGEELRERAIAVDLAAALDEWALSVGTDRKRLAAIASAADPDDTRASIRKAMLDGDVDALRAAAEGATEDPRTADLLAMAFLAAGDAEAAVEQLRRAWWEHPDDFWVSFHLARTLASLDPPRWEEAARFYTTASTRRPHADWIRTQLEECLRRSGSDAK